MSSIKIPSNDKIRASFTYPVFDKIIPTYQSIQTLEKQAIRNAATVECRVPAPHQNLAGVIEQPDAYLLPVGTPFPNIQYPGDIPNIPPGATHAQKIEITAIYNLNLRLHLTIQRLDTIIATMIENAIEHMYLATSLSTYSF